jgi:hypothetical protein
MQKNAEIFNVSALLLCDCTNLREVGEVNRKQDGGMSNSVTSVTSHYNADTSCQQRTKLCTPHICSKRKWTRPFRPYTKIVFCSCANTSEPSCTSKMSCTHNYHCALKDYLRERHCRPSTRKYMVSTGSYRWDGRFLPVVF